jgi:hypothetical protein
MLAQVVVARLLAVDVPPPGLPWGQGHLVAGVFVVVLVVIKFVRETEFLGYGAYSAILGGLLVAYGGFLVARDSAVPA